jgi:hypothetical protein
MNARDWIVLSVLVLAAIAGGVWFFSPVSYRFRITVAVETPQGVREGASVLETSTIYQPTFLGATGGRFPSLHGQAVFVDLGQGRHLIGLLAHGPRGEGVDGVMMLPVSAFGLRSSGVGRGQNAHEMAAALPAGSRRELSSDLIPTLVTFGDLADPASARVVEPTDAGFASAFGPGFRLAGVTLEMVPAGTWPFNLVGLSGTPVTRGIEGKLAFLKRMRDDGLSGRIDTDPNRFIPNFPYFVRG